MVASGAQIAADVHIAALGQQQDAAALLHGAVGKDGAAHVDEAVQHALGGLGRDQNGLAAADIDHARLGNQAFDRLPLRVLQLRQTLVAQCEVDQTVAVQIDRKGVRRAQHDPAQTGLDQAVVAHMGGHQRDQSALGGGDAAGVDNARAGLAGLVEDQFALHEVFVAEVGRAGDQAADVDLGALAEDDAVGVDQQHLAVGVQAAQNHGDLAARDAVERGGTGRRLRELHLLVRTDAEAAPVDDGALDCSAGSAFCCPGR